MTAKVALVTGASSGIGAAIAAALSRDGFHVVLTGRNAERLAHVAAGLPGASFPLILDLTDGPGITSLHDRLPEAFRDIAVLVNNAGHDVGGRRFFDEGTAEDWSAIIEANLLGLVRLTHVVSRGMIARGQGDIVNIGSLAAIRPAPRMAAYAASKAGVHALSDVLRADLARHGIRVTEILPGLTRTAFAATRLGGDQAAADRFYDKANASLSPADVADGVIYALARPRHMSVAQLVLVPSGQW